MSVCIGTFRLSLMLKHIDYYPTKTALNLLALHNKVKIRTFVCYNLTWR